MAKDFQKQRNQPTQSPGAVGGEFSNEPVLVGMPWRLMIFSFILLLLGVFIFLGLRFGYTIYLDGQMEALNEEIDGLSTQVSKGEQEEFLAFYSQLSNLRGILEKRDFSQNILGFLEEKTLPLVYYNEAVYSEEDGNVSLVGASQSIKTLVGQMAIFKDSPEVNSVELGSVSLSILDQGVDFEVSVIFNPGFFDQPAE